jgi:hypothetical protein
MTEKVNVHSPLSELHADFRAGSTTAMPLAGMLCWGALGVAAYFVSPQMAGTLALYIMAGILPLAFLIEKARGRNLFAKSDNPLDALFLTSIVGVGITVPLVLVAAQAADQPILVVLGMAILAGVIWIPYGWAADDRAGIIHAVGRAIGSYLAYAFTPAPATASAICAVVVASYLYSFMFMKKVGE